MPLRVLQRWEAVLFFPCPVTNSVALFVALLQALTAGGSYLPGAHISSTRSRYLPGLRVAICCLFSRFARVIGHRVNTARQNFSPQPPSAVPYV